MMTQALNHILAIDIGNTRLKWALHDGANWVAQGARSTRDSVAPSMLVEEWAQLAPHLVPNTPPYLPNLRAIISNVADKTIMNAVRSALSAIGCVESDMVISKAMQCGVRNGYANPAQLGTDRWLALIAAFASMNRTTKLSGEAAYPQLVVMAGTALTIDALTAEGDFLGGVIVAGATLMRAALNHGTARLPAEPGAHALFPTCTENAIATGAIEACLGAIQRMHAALEQRTGCKATCVASGGGLAYLAPYLPTLPFSIAIHDNLVLDGLIRIAYAIE
jgi:type III pantothenate kinase